MSVSPSVDAPKRADTSRECYLKYFMRRPHRTDLLLVGAREHYSGCTSLHLQKRIATGATHHPPTWHTSHMFMVINFSYKQTFGFSTAIFNFITIEKSISDINLEVFRCIDLKFVKSHHNLLINPVSMHKFIINSN